MSDSEKEDKCECDKEETDEDREKIDNFKIYFNELLKEENRKTLIFSKYEASFSEIKEFLHNSGVKFSELKDIHRESIILLSLTRVMSLEVLTFFC